MTKEEYDSLENGQHFWGLLDNELVMLAKDARSLSFEVCGAWECGVLIEDVTFIEFVDTPKGHEQTRFYYF